MSISASITLNGERLAEIWSAQANYFAHDAGPNAQPTGHHNMGFGLGAVASVTTGVMNVAMGHQALGSCTVGSDNTAFGGGVLQTLTGGVGNTGMGRLALANATVTSACTGLGDTALEFLTTGIANTAVGYSAGIRITTGEHNVTVGNFAGGHATIGTSCVFSRCVIVGSEAAMSLVSGNDNVVLGYRGAHVTTGSENVGAGTETLRELTTGVGNLAVGHQSGWRVTTGGDNVFVGHKAGFDGNQKVDVTNSIAVGADTFTTANNQIVIGNANAAEIILCGVAFTKAQLIALKALL